MKRALLVLVLAACDETPPPAASRQQAAVAAPVESADATLAMSCQSCHSRMLIEQQRLDAAQWTKVLEKMRGWGATLTGERIPSLAEQLSKQYGPDAKLPAPSRLDAAAAARSLAPLDDGPFAGGDRRQGATLFGMRCSMCHAADARGGIGVSLVDRLLLQRAPEFAAQVRQGRGQMLGNPDLTDAQLGQVLAYLRSL